MSRAGGCSHCLPPGFSPFVSVELHTNPRGEALPSPKSHPRQRCCRGVRFPVGRRQSQCLGGTWPPFAGPRGCPPPGGVPSIPGRCRDIGNPPPPPAGQCGPGPLGGEPLPHRPAKKNQPRGKTPWRHCRALCPSVRLTVEGCRPKVSASSRPSKGPGTEVLPGKSPLGPPPRR